VNQVRIAFWYNRGTMRAVAILALTSLLGCFPHNHKARTYAKYGEGGAVLAGIGMEFLVNSGADCDQMTGPLQSSSSCHTRATALGDFGVALILGGLLGFVATVSTSDDEDTRTPAATVIKDDKPAEKPVVKLPAGVKGPTAQAGSAAPAQP
jgi:hypothetical protein